MVSLLKPRLNRLFGGPHSIAQLVTAPSAPFTSITIHEWGLVHSIFVTVPRSVTDCLMSNSAAKAWCANNGAAASTIPTPATATDNLVRIGFLLAGKSTILTGIIVLLPAIIVQFDAGTGRCAGRTLFGSFRILGHINARQQRDMPKIALKAGVLIQHVRIVRSLTVRLA